MKIYETFVVFAKYMFRVNVLTGFLVDFTIFVAVWAETDRFFLKKREKRVLLSLPNYLFSMLKSCFTDLFYVGWIQRGSCFMCITLSTCYKSIQSKKNSVILEMS